VKFGALTRLLRISGRVFPVLTYAHCAPRPVADWVHMEPTVAAELLNFLKSKGAFEPDAGSSPIWEVWHAEGKQFTSLDLEGVCAE